MPDTGDVTFPLIDVSGFSSPPAWQGMNFFGGQDKIRFQGLVGPLGDVVAGNVTFPRIIFITDFGIGNVVFPRIEFGGNSTPLQAGSGIYKIEVNRTHDTYYDLEQDDTINTKIPDPFLQTALMHDEDENFIHMASYRIRVVGSGNLHATLYTLNSIQSQVLTDVVLTSTSAREQTILSNFTSQRIMLRLQTNVIDNTFDITRVIMFLKTLWTQKPSFNPANFTILSEDGADFLVAEDGVTIIIQE